MILYWLFHDPQQGTAKHLSKGLPKFPCTGMVRLFLLCAGSGSDSVLLLDFLICPPVNSDFFGSSSPGNRIGWCRVRGLK